MTYKVSSGTLRLHSLSPSLTGSRLVTGDESLRPQRSLGHDADNGEQRPVLLRRCFHNYTTATANTSPQHHRRQHPSSASPLSSVS